MADPISDMLIRIKNAALAKKDVTVIPHSKIKLEIARILKETNFITKFDRRGKKNRKFIEVGIAYNADGQSRITDVKRISKPSRRVYRQASELKRVGGGAGIAIISTSKGLRTDKEARREHLGGEIICEVW